MANENFISFWEKTLQEGKQKFVLKTWLRFFILLLILDILINKFAFGDPSIIDYFMNDNLQRVGEKLGIWFVGSLVMSYIEFWITNKRYEKLKSDS